jgi:hypothetical protein
MAAKSKNSLTASQKPPLSVPQMQSVLFKQLLTERTIAKLSQKTCDKVTPYRQGRLDALESLLDALDLLQAFNEWEQLQRQLRQGHAVKGA